MFFEGNSCCGECYFFYPVVVHLDCLYADVALVADLEGVRLLPVALHVPRRHALAAVGALGGAAPAVRRVSAVVGQGNVAFAAGGEEQKGWGSIKIISFFWWMIYVTSDIVSFIF